MRIVIADDHALFRDGLRSLLEARGFDVVGEAADGTGAIRLAGELKPELILMDLSMPGGGGLEATRAIKSAQPTARIVILTASTDDEPLFEAIKAGADGYIQKNLEADDFFPLLESAMRGEPALTPQLAKKVLAEFAKPSAKPRAEDPDALTDREQEVLELMVRGHTSNRKLARQLGVSENTVKFHVRNILDKLRLHTRAEVVGYALRNKLVDSE